MSRPIETREYQQRLVQKIMDAYKADYRSVLLESPTGSGKTITCLLALKRMQQAKPSLTIGWVAMRRKLLQQAFEENERIGVQNIEFVSMFDKNPPKRKVMVVDECLPASAKLICLVNGQPEVIIMGDVISGIGTHVLSEDDSGLIFQPIMSRTDMGVKELIEVKTTHGTLLITENGKVFSGGEYVRVSDLRSGMRTRDLSCCQTDRTRDTACEQISETPNREADRSTTLRVRVWPKGSVELARTLLSQVFVQAAQDRLSTGPQK